MKKYIDPKVRIVEVEVEEILTESLDVNIGGGDPVNDPGAQLSNGAYYFDEEEY